MKKDIDFPEVSGVSVAVVKETNTEGEMQWNVYLINQKDNELETVLISATGYGEIGGEKKKTSTLRHSFPKIPAQSFAYIEPMTEEVFALANEYWVSFYIGNTIFDKKFIFLPESIQERNFINVPVLNKSGVLIG